MEPMYLTLRNKGAVNTTKGNKPLYPNGSAENSIYLGTGRQILKSLQPARGGGWDMGRGADPVYPRGIINR